MSKLFSNENENILNPENSKQEYKLIKNENVNNSSDKDATFKETIESFLILKMKNLGITNDDDILKEIVKISERSKLIQNLFEMNSIEVSSVKIKETFQNLWPTISLLLISNFKPELIYKFLNEFIIFSIDNSFQNLSKSIIESHVKQDWVKRPTIVIYTQDSSNPIISIRYLSKINKVSFFSISSTSILNINIDQLYPIIEDQNHWIVIENLQLLNLLHDSLIVKKINQIIDQSKGKVFLTYLISGNSSEQLKKINLYIIQGKCMIKYYSQFSHLVFLNPHENIKSNMNYYFQKEFTSYLSNASTLKKVLLKTNVMKNDIQGLELITDIKNAITK